MKALQDNFTTPEQSKRLLELGVPKWTADCYHGWFPEGVQVKPSPFADPSNPCWSVGRLMEIITMCHLSRDNRFCFKKDMCESLVEAICAFIEYGEMDFSKLEE